MSEATKQPRSKPLSPELVVEAARRITRVNGLEGLTMRAVAAELGVTPMALYYHVANKDELVWLLARAVLDGSVPLRLGTGDWETALRDHLVSHWEVLREYPGLAAYMISLPTMGTTDKAFEHGVEFFEEAGFTRHLAQLAWSFALTFLHGRLSVEAGIDRTAASEAGLDGINAADHVNFGVDAVIAALAAMLASPEMEKKYRPRQS